MDLGNNYQKKEKKSLESDEKKLSIQKENSYKMYS